MNAKNLLVSVVILSRDGALLQPTLDSARAQTFPSLEVVVVEPSLDPSDAMNAGANRSTGEYLCFLPAGETLPPTYLEKCLFLAETGGFGLSKSSPLRLDTLLPDRLPSQVQVVRKAVFLAREKTATPKAAAPPNADVQFSYANLITRQDQHSPTILLAMPFLTMGGAEAVISQFCGQLKALGFRLLVITTLPAADGLGDTSAWFEGSVAGIYDLPQFLDLSLWPAFICYLIQQHSVGAIWQVGSAFLYDLLPQIRQLFPAITIVDQLFNPVGHTANYLKYSYLIDHVVTEHAGMKDWLLEHGETEDRISVVPSGVNLEWHKPRPRVDWRTGQSRQPGDGRFVVGFIGRLSEEKGPDVFIDIAAQLAGRPDLEFLLCGGGPMEDHLRARIAARGLSKRIDFLGFIPVRGGPLPSCDVVVVCSRLDGRPNLVMESLAMGIPVIASRVGGIPEMIPEGRAGTLCEPGDVRAFAGAIRELADNPELYHRYCSAARSHAEEHFSFTESGKRYAHIFQESGKSRAGLSREISATSAAASLGLPPVPSRISPASRILVAFRVLRMILSPWRLRMNYRNAKLYWRLGRKTPDQSGSTVADHFDTRYYLRMYPDVTASGIPPLLHYVFCGFREGRDPSQRFNSTRYMAQHPDVARSGVNPLLHYLCSQDQYPLH